MWWWAVAGASEPVRTIPVEGWPAFDDGGALVVAEGRNLVAVDPADGRWLGGVSLPEGFEGAFGAVARTPKGLLVTVVPGPLWRGDRELGVWSPGGPIRWIPGPICQSSLDAGGLLVVRGRDASCAELAELVRLDPDLRPVGEPWPVPPGALHLPALAAGGEDLLRVVDRGVLEVRTGDRVASIALPGVSTAGWVGPRVLAASSDGWWMIEPRPEGLAVVGSGEGGFHSVATAGDRALTQSFEGWRLVDPATGAPLGPTLAVGGRRPWHPVVLDPTGTRVAADGAGVAVAELGPAPPPARAPRWAPPPLPPPAPARAEEVVVRGSPGTPVWFRAGAHEVRGTIGPTGDTVVTLPWGEWRDVGGYRPLRIGPGSGPLEPLPDWVLTVLDADRLPVSGAPLEVRYRDGGSFTGVTGADGTLAVPNRAGWVEARLPDGRLATGCLALDCGTGVGVYPSVSYRLRDPAGAPVVGVSVGPRGPPTDAEGRSWFVPAQAPPTIEGRPFDPAGGEWTLPSGRVAVDGPVRGVEIREASGVRVHGEENVAEHVAPGTAEVRAVIGAGVAIRTVEVPPEGEVRVAISAPDPPGELRLHVVAADPRIQVWARAEVPSFGIGAEPDAGGDVLLAGLPPGPVAVDVRGFLRRETVYAQIPSGGVVERTVVLDHPFEWPGLSLTGAEQRSPLSVFFDPGDRLVRLGGLPMDRLDPAAVAERMDGPDPVPAVIRASDGTERQVLFPGRPVCADGVCRAGGVVISTGDELSFEALTPPRPPPPRVLRPPEPRRQSCADGDPAACAGILGAPVPPWHLTDPPRPAPDGDTGSVRVRSPRAASRVALLDAQGGWQEVLVAPHLAFGGVPAGPFEVRWFAADGRSWRASGVAEAGREVGARPGPVAPGVEVAITAADGSGRRTHDRRAPHWQAPALGSVYREGPAFDAVSEARFVVPEGGWWVTVPDGGGVLRAAAGGDGVVVGEVFRPRQTLRLGAGRVVAGLDDPLRWAALQPGDEVREVDGADVSALPTDSVWALLEGAAEPVRVGVWRGGERVELVLPGAPRCPTPNRCVLPTADGEVWWRFEAGG